ncbi:Fibronectin type III domain-containing protein [Myxococcus fulvus]|uniref:Fibronectin type III domain-containing protein n=2 Tax=Myxococcus fulvus TaxID=33 RepID=A0ABY1CUB7_MYXFU|nr:fibronectin type III domain-containing protein [Myxococcus fulvus]SEU38433.1 Fibronectin type III domain-containing protein [Myxococcus fulvus]
MARNAMVVVARPEWVTGGSPWWSTFKVTLLNLSDEAVVNPAIGFRVAPDQVVQNNYGLLWRRHGDTLTGTLVAERQTIAPRASQEFRLSIRTEGAHRGALPSCFTVDGEPADPPRDVEPPSSPRRVRATLVGSRLCTLGWDASTDNVAVAGYQVTYSSMDREQARTLTCTRPSITLTGLTPRTEYLVSVAAYDLSDNLSKLTPPVMVRTAAPLPDAGDWDVPRAPFLDLASAPRPIVSELARACGLDGVMLGGLGVRAGGARKVAWGGHLRLVDAVDGRSHEAEASVSDYGKEDLEAFRRSGGRVVLSFGGGAGLMPLEVEETDVARLVATYAAILRNYQVRHLDFAFDSAFLHDDAGLERHVAAMSQLLLVCPSLRLSYSLPADGAPGALAGFNDAGVRLLQRLSSAGIEPSLVNGLLLELGPTAPVDTFECCAQALHGMHAHLSAAFPRWDTDKVWRRLGASPLFGGHPNGRDFTLEHQRRLVALAHKLRLGCLSGRAGVRDTGLSFSRCIATYLPGASSTRALTS